MEGNGMGYYLLPTNHYNYYKCNISPCTYFSHPSLSSLPSLCNESLFLHRLRPMHITCFALDWPVSSTFHKILHWPCDASLKHSQCTFFFSSRVCDVTWQTCLQRCLLYKTVHTQVIPVLLNEKLWHRRQMPK